MENNRKKKHTDLEVVPVGFANGISTQLAQKRALYGAATELTEVEKQEIVQKAAKAYGEFLDALGCDWRNDPNSADTPKRVAKAYVHDLWKGRFSPMSEITSFPSDGYDGIVIERPITLPSNPTT